MQRLAQSKQEGKGFIYCATLPKPLLMLNGHWRVHAPISHLGSKAHLPLFLLYHDLSIYVQTASHRRAPTPLRHSPPCSGLLRSCPPASRSKGGPSTSSWNTCLRRQNATQSAKHWRVSSSTGSLAGCSLHSFLSGASKALLGPAAASIYHVLSVT